MPAIRRVPPGRAGRLWLAHRLAVAHRGADLLDQKLRILRADRRRLALLVEQTGQEWEAASREAEGWLVRTALVDGDRALRLSAAPSFAEVEVEWAHSMGVRYPSTARCVPPEPDPDANPVGSAALDRARAAFRRALEAAVQHAATEAAVAVMEAEERSTRRRLRAVQNRWIPRLEQAAAEVRNALEETEHAELVRMRWASGRRPVRSRGGEEER